MKEFIHLHNHTEYSLLDGFARIKNLVKEAKEQGATSLAITDHGNMYGMVKFYEECTKQGINPILGCEFYLVDDLYVKARGDKRYHLILLAKNLKGYHNLAKLSSIAFVDGFYDKPRIDMAVLKKYSADLVCLSGCIAGKISQILLDENKENRMEEATQCALEFKDIFGEDFYVEVQNHGIEEEMRVLPLLKKIAKNISVKTVATNDIHYIKKEDSKAHDVLLCVQTASDYDAPKRFRFPNDEFYYKNREEMLNVIGDEDALDNTLEVANKCRTTLIFNDYTIPVYVPPENFADDAEYLRSLAFEGLVERYGVVTDEIKKRAEYELKTIIQMGFASYYLIVWDFINFSKANGIPVGAGRGSGVGSIIAYAIRITDVDPLKYDLIFERFLNSSRASMPDFDIDFCSDRREETIAYVREKYHLDHVAQIITFGTMKKKNAIKNVARVFKIPFADANKLVKDIPDDPKVKIADLINPDNQNAVASLIEMYTENPQYKEIIDYAMAVEDLPRDRGKHAAGVIICSLPVSDVVPLSRNGEDITTQFDMNECERLGLLKMDFLALKTLTDIDKAKQYVFKNQGVKIDFQELGYEDANVYNMIGNGNTDTVFQLESGGMKKFMKQLRPSLLEEIIAGVSLYRPGPMDYIPAYVNNKIHQDAIDYRHPSLKPILQNTYGVIVYQEQAMRITQALAGYTLNEADNFRKFISKKKVDQIPMQRAKFIKGCLKNNVSEQFANTVWDELEKFGSYAFNKSHAAAYSVLTYQTAYLKNYFPVEYLCAVMNNRIGNPDDTSKYLKLIKDMGILLLPPDINSSEALFTPQGKKDIRYGLVCIKNVGKVAIDNIVKERETNGKFLDFSDFARRVSGESLNRRMIESLIKGGAFDVFGYSRATMMANYEKILDNETSARSLIEGGQLFFDFMVEEQYKYIIVPDNSRKKLQEEKEVLGRYISGHPLDNYEEEFAKFTFNTAMLLPVEEDLTNEEELEGDDKEGNVTYGVESGTRVFMGGILSDITTKFSAKSGKKWAFGIIEDMAGSVEVVFYNQVLERKKDLIVNDQLVKISGKVVIEEDRPPKIEVRDVNSWYLEEKVEVADTRTLCILIPNDDKVFEKVYRLLQENKGGQGKVKLQVEKTLYPLDFNVTNIDGLKNQLIGMVGFNSVKVLG